jgi:hypothetical protein
MSNRPQTNIAKAILRLIPMGSKHIFIDETRQSNLHSLGQLRTNRKSCPGGNIDRQC